MSKSGRRCFAISVALATEVVTLEEAHVPAEAAALVAEDKKCNISNLFKVWKS